MRAPALIALASVLLLSACGPAAEAELVEEAALEPGFEGEASDCVLAPPASPGLGSSAQALADGTPQVVYVNFSGPKILDCAGCSDAPTNRSLVMGHFSYTHGYQFKPYTDTARKTAILGYLRSWFAPYNVTFTTSRPASGPYTMAVVSPSWVTSGSHGISPLDCDDTNRNDIVFVYRTGETARFPTAAKVAQAVAHEIGHSLGLAHVTGSSQIMQYASSGAAFGVANYDTAHPSGKCFSGSVQDAPAILRTSVGGRP